METERAKRLAEFVSWVGTNIRGDEKGEAQVFLDRLFRGLGLEDCQYYRERRDAWLRLESFHAGV
jgi:hypothetical protein